MYTHKITKNSSRFNSRLKQNCNQDPSRRYTPRGRGGKNWNRKNLEQLPRRKISRYVFGVCMLLFTLEFQAEMCKSLWDGSRKRLVGK